MQFQHKGMDFKYKLKGVDRNYQHMEFISTLELRVMTPILLVDITGM